MVPLAFRGLALMPALVAALVYGRPWPSASTQAAAFSTSRDTITPRPTTGAARSTGDKAGTVIPGYLSSWGLPPVQGQVILTDSGLVFQAVRDSVSTRASSLALAYVEDENGRAHYLFRMDAGVFETDAPGPLLSLAADSAWFHSGKPNTAAVQLTADSAASLRLARAVAASPYADSLYALFGQPQGGIGLIGRRGRAAGRLGEYIAVRDSLALDPARMTGEMQLRHALAHELGHRWQGRARSQLATLWSGVRAIRDPKRYGYGARSEHQAEAIAFAVSFLQTTAGRPDNGIASLALLDHYDLLVPGTRTLVRYLALQPIYRNHPLRSQLTAGLITYALEK